MSELYFDWNEIRYRLGMPLSKYGSDRIVTAENPWKPEFSFDDEYLAETGQIKVIMSYDLMPKSEYYER